MAGPISFVYGSCAWKPRRIASSLVIASTSSTLEGDEAVRALRDRVGDDAGVRFLSAVIEVEACVAQTRLPRRSFSDRAGESDGTSTRWPASR